MLDLPQVTLCCVDGVNHALALRALERSRSEVRFARALLLTDSMPPWIEVPVGIDVVSIGPIDSEEAYSRFVLKGLFQHVDTTHALLVQWDGYVVHPGQWRASFLETDYLGAPWIDGSVGNGGFSLRSRRLLGALQHDSFNLVTTNEDVTICGVYRHRLESEFAIRFGTADLARRFSFEMDTADALEGEQTFGFHGIFNLFLVEPEAEIVSLTQHLSDQSARSGGAAHLLNNLVRSGMRDAAVALARRMVAADACVTLPRELVAYAGDLLPPPAGSESTGRKLARRMLGRFGVSALPVSSSDRSS